MQHVGLTLCTVQQLFNMFHLWYNAVILENLPRDDSGIVAVQPSGYVSGSNTVHVEDTQSWPQDPPTQPAPEIEDQIISVHSIQSRL